MVNDFDPFRPYKLAQIYCAKGDVSRQWYCYYFYKIPGTNDFKMFKQTGGMNRIHNGKRRMRYAKLLQRAINEKLISGFSPFPKVKDTSTLKSCIEKHLTDHVRNLKPRTYTTAKSAMMKLVPYCDNVQDITKEKIITALNELQKKKKWSNRQRNNILARWRTLFNWLISQEIIEKNPTDRIPFLKVYPTDVTRPATEEEFSRIVNCLYENDRRLFLYFGFIYYQGFRVTETGFLQRSKFEFNTEHPYIRLAAGDQKDNEVTYQFISPHFLPYLLEMEIDNLPTNYYLFSTNLVPSEKPLLKIKELAETRWRELIKEGLGIPVNLYSSKHKQATELGEKLSDEQISPFFRHSSPKTTRIYMKDKRMTVPYSFYENQRPLPLHQSSPPVKVVKIK